MTIYKNDPNCEILYTSKNHTFITVGNAKIRKDKITHLEILIKLIQSEVKPVYDRADRENSHQFQSL